MTLQCKLFTPLKTSLFSRCRAVKFFPDGASCHHGLHLSVVSAITTVKLFGDLTSSGDPAHVDSAADEALNCSTPVGQNNWSADWWRAERQTDHDGTYRRRSPSNCARPLVPNWSLWNERSVIFREEDDEGRERVTEEEELVLIWGKSTEIKFRR